MPSCQAPIPDGTLLDYWARDLAEGDETDRVEEHLFACGDCSARLHRLAALGPGLATLVRQGRVSGIVSRGLLNRMQREGIHVRTYSLAPGETVPCAVFPGDDLVVAALRADFSGVEAVTLSVTGSGDWPRSEMDDLPVSGPDGEVLWALPAAVVRQMPSMRLQLTLASVGATGAELGRYVLDHSASPLSA
jgi:hypothetical protein